MALNFESLQNRLAPAFSQAEELFRQNLRPALPDPISHALQRIFTSATQAFREVLLGCVLVALEDSSIDIRKPYSDQAANAFSGRSLDENVVNPFLHEKRVPSSRGPYLSVFRRSVDFTPATRQGVRDKVAFDAFLELVEYVRVSSHTSKEAFLISVLCAFVALREASNIPLTKLNRMSAVQYQRLIAGLLKISSGGRLPTMIVVAVLQAIKAHFSLGWSIEYQGINEADSAAGAGGDVTVRDQGSIVLAAEITERHVDKARVVATFNRKIGPAAIEDYIFFASATEEAIVQSNQYFAQGSEVNFVDILSWAWISLITIGQSGRDAFNVQMLLMLDLDDVPRGLKVAWNDLVATITSV